MSVPPPAPVKAAAPPKLPPISVKVSDVPDERISQLAGFFRRNPGYARTSGTNAAVVGVLERHRPTEWAANILRPTELGHGQAIYDQMRWQIRTGRQPDNEWWMRMNKQTVLDPLKAESLLRAGRRDELSTKSEKAWAKYIDMSDNIRKALGVPEGVSELATKDGQITPIALGDAWKGASLLKRMQVKWHLIPRAKQLFWKAHVASLHEARKHVDKQFQSVDAKWTKELQMASGFRNFVDGYVLINPPAVGGFTRFSQKALLPEIHPTIPEKLPLRQRVAFKLMTLLDRTYESDKKRIAQTGPTGVDDPPL